jgi:uncharacterized protein YdiU (UPF0061 family)
MYAVIQIPFDNRYVQLGEPFYSRATPSSVRQPELIKFNEELARELGIEYGGADISMLASVFSGNTIPDGAEPLAMAYAGHQFGNFTPQLGDGRAILLGEIGTATNDCFEVQLKGAGRTAYSRNGDGRAALGPVLREYLVSEAMAKLNIPTTRALAAVATGEPVLRERALPGGVITRVASSFVRVGSFQYFAARGEIDAVKALADHVIARNYPESAQVDNPYIALLESVAAQQAQLIAQWMQVGFIHGVMNTDNMSIAGETIDYGPCAFMDTYAHRQVFSSIDAQGRYAYNKQPGMGLWNLTRLAESLLPLLADSTSAAIKIAEKILQTFSVQYEQAWLEGMRTKVGLTPLDGRDQQDRELIESLFDVMAANNADFTLVFYHLSHMALQPGEHDESNRELFDRPAEFDDWAASWRERLAHERQTDTERQARMRAVNPVYIPRNHQIEAAIRAAEDEGDFSVFHALHEVLQQPFTEQPGKERYRLPPEPQEVVEMTFCGT